MLDDKCSRMLVLGGTGPQNACFGKVGMPFWCFSPPGPYLGRPASSSLQPSPGPTAPGPGPLQNSIKREGVPFRREKIIHQVPRRPRGPRPLGPGPLQNLSFGSFSPPGTPRRPNSSSVGSTFAEKGARKRASDRKRKWLPHIGQHSIVQWRDWRFAQLDPPAPSFTKVARAC